MNFGTSKQPKIPQVSVTPMSEIFTNALMISLICPDKPEVITKYMCLRGVNSIGQRSSTNDKNEKLALAERRETLLGIAISLYLATSAVVTDEKLLTMPAEVMADISSLQGFMEFYEEHEKFLFLGDEEWIIPKDEDFQELKSKAIFKQYNAHTYLLKHNLTAVTQECRHILKQYHANMISRALTEQDFKLGIEELRKLEKGIRDKLRGDYNQPISWEMYDIKNKIKDKDIHLDGAILIAQALRVAAHKWSHFYEDDADTLNPCDHFVPRVSDKKTEIENGRFYLTVVSNHLYTNCPEKRSQRLMNNILTIKSLWGMSGRAKARRLADLYKQSNAND